MALIPEIYYDYDSVRATLPNSELGNDRCLEIGFTHHADFKIEFWNGDINGADEAENKKLFIMRHGVEVLILSSLMGYLRRSGLDELDVKQILTDAAQPVLEDELFSDQIPARFNMEVQSLDYLRNGEPSPRYNNDFLQWDALDSPVTSQPGILEKVGGVGLFTRTSILGEFLMVLTWHEGNYNSFSVSPNTYELCKADVPVAARAICLSSKGDYRRDIYAMVAGFGNQPN